jgi:hypothetical protein
MWINTATEWLAEYWNWQSTETYTFCRGAGRQLALLKCYLTTLSTACIIQQRRCMDEWMKSWMTWMKGYRALMEWHWLEKKKRIHSKETRSHCHSVNHIPHEDWPVIESRRLRWTADVYTPETWHGKEWYCFIWHENCVRRMIKWNACSGKQKKYSLVSAQNAQLHLRTASTFRNSPSVPNFSLYTPLQITHVRILFFLRSCICKLNFHLRPRGIKMEQQTRFRSPGGQIIPFPVPRKTKKSATYKCFWRTQKISQNQTYKLRLFSLAEIATAFPSD